MNPLEKYLKELYDIRCTGAATPETFPVSDEDNQALAVVILER